MRALLWFTLLPALLLMPMSLLAETHAELFDSCSVCHPTETVGTAPAWNSAGQNVVYATYATAPSTVDRTSVVCLSCHSTSSQDATRATETWLVSGAGGDAGCGDHPIGVDFEHARSLQGGLQSSWTPSGLGGSIGDDLLVDGRVECTSCHDVHHTQNAPYLTMSNDGSALCLTRHEK